MILFIILLISYVHCQKCNVNFAFSDYAYFMDHNATYDSMQDAFEYEFSFDSKLNN